MPPSLEQMRAVAERALNGVTPTKYSHKSPYPSSRTVAGRKLPAQYLVYFLLTELLGFKDLGRHEKVAWTIPIEYKGKIFAIEHRKLGLGIFATNLAEDEATAEEICAAIKRAVRASAPFFELLAEQAIQKSELNVKNKSRGLFERYEYFRDRYREKSAEAEQRRDERIETRTETEGGGVFISSTMPYYPLKTEARWLAISSIDAFYSWTEHAFIHLALLQGRIRTGKETADLIGADWGDKFKRALDIKDRAAKIHFDMLGEIRRQVRNFIAHGSFGKEGEAFEFHSSAGAVPVLMPHKRGKSKFALSGRFAFKDDEALAEIESFIGYLWSGARKPAYIHIQQENLPTILTMVNDGTYDSAMKSVDDMEGFCKYLNYQMDTAADMDWWPTPASTPVARRLALSTEDPSFAPHCLHKLL